MRKILCTLAMMGMFAFAAAAQSNGNYPQSSNSPTTTQNDQSANPNNPQQATPANPDQNNQATPSTSNQNSSATSSQTADQQEDQNEAMNKSGHHEKSLRGCIESQNGQFVLQEKNGKMAKLSSTEDLSAHVGHEVKLRGMWVTGAASTSNMGNTTASAEPNKYPSTDSSNTTTTNSGNQSNAPAGTSTETQSGNTTMAQNGNSGSISSSNNMPQSDMSANGTMKWDHADQTFQVSNIKMKSDHCTMKTKGSSTQTGVGNNPPSM